MRSRILWTRTAVAAVLAAGTGAAVAGAAGVEGRDRPITGPALGQASAAALAATGGGTVTGTEVDDEDGYYEVEVTLADGRQVDVALDRDFTVLGSTTDRDRPADDGRTDR